MFVLYVSQSDIVRLTSVFCYHLDAHNQHINCWEKDDTKFTETNATHKIFEKLKTESCVLVVGHPGTGKSSIIRHIALKLRNEYQYDIISKVLRPCNILELINKNKKQIFLVDDLCGKENMNAQSAKDWLSQIYDILNLIDTSGKYDSKDVVGVKFLFAVGDNIYDDINFKEIKPLMKHVFKLSKCTLTNDEKLTMMNIYIAPETQKKLSQTLEYDKDYFPLLCKIAEKKEENQIIKLFNNLNDFIRQDLLALQNSNHLKFCVITLCAVLNNNLKEEILNESTSDIETFEKTVFKNVCLEFNLGPNKDIVNCKIKEQLENLGDSYIAKTGDSYHFIHTKVYEIAVLVCGTIFLHTFINFVRSSFIAECFIFQSNSTDNNKHKIIISNKNAEKKYFDRLMLDLKQGETYTTFHNSQLCSDSFRSKLLLYCQNRKEKVSDLLKQFSVKSDSEGDYEDYTEFTDHSNFYSHKMRKPLIESAWEGHKDIVQMLLEFNCDINETDRFGRTALFVACLFGKNEVVNILLERNADCLLCDKIGQSPLLVASRERYDEIVKTLLNHGADVYQCDNNGNSPLLVASSVSQLSTSQLLSRNMTNISKPNKLGQTSVFFASMNGREDVLKYLLSFQSEFLSTPDHEGRSPLFIACMKGHLNVVELLLKRGADVTQFDWNMQSPLFIASAEGHDNIVTTLITHDADIDQCEEDGMTPIGVACDKGRTGVVNILIRNKADINVPDNKNRTPLYAASRRGFQDIVKLLHANNASISVCNKWGGSPLSAACRQGHFDIVKYLVENHADVNSQDMNGTTPLLVASENGNTEIGQFLIDNGSVVNQSDQYERTPLHVAAVGGHDTIAEVLIQKFADITRTDSDNKTPLDLASKFGFTKIVKLLSSDN